MSQYQRYKATPPVLTDGQVTEAITDKYGRALITQNFVTDKVQQVTTITASTSETTVLTAVAATYLDVYGVIITNTGSTDVTVAFKDATAGTTRFNLAVKAGATAGFTFPSSDGHLQSAVNNNWTATSSGSTSSLVITMFAIKRT